MHRLRTIGLAVLLLATASTGWAHRGHGRYHHSRFRAARRHTARHLRSHAGHAHSLQTSAEAPVSSAAFDLAHFDEAPGTCRSKGRLQDKQYCSSQTVDGILSNGKAAIPMLIASLTDERKVPPIYDQWEEMTVGDIAYFVLDDLFTDPSAEVPKRVLEGCQASPDACWHNFLDQHGRQFVQDQWRSAWSANKDRVFWDDNVRCFRLAPRDAQQAGMVRTDFLLHRRRSLLRRHHK